MSAASASKPEPSPPEPGDADGWALLDGLRRKLDDQGIQIRKNTAHVTQLAESIAALVELQRRRSRWINLNSFVAYLVFTVLLGAAFYYLYASRAHALVGDRDAAVRRADDADRRADDATARLVARDAADAKALEAYQLLEAGKRDDAAKRLAELSSAPLPRLEREVLDARARQPEPSKADAAIKGAIAAFKAGRFGDAIAPVEAALAADPDGPKAGELHYLAGIARAKTGAIDQAIAHLDAAVAANVGEDDVHFQLASALDRAGQWGKARVEYDRFATAHPQSPFAAYAMRRSAMLGTPVQRAPAVAPAPAAAPKSDAPAQPPGPGSASGSNTP